MYFLVVMLTVSYCHYTKESKNKRFLTENEHRCAYLPYHSTFENHNECLLDFKKYQNEQL